MKRWITIDKIKKYLLVAVVFVIASTLYLQGRSHRHGHHGRGHHGHRRHYHGHRRSYYGGYWGPYYGFGPSYGWYYGYGYPYYEYPLTPTVGVTFVRSSSCQKKNTAYSIYNKTDRVLQARTNEDSKFIKPGEIIAIAYTHKKLIIQSHDPDETVTVCPSYPSVTVIENEYGKLSVKQ